MNETHEYAITQIIGGNGDELWVRSTCSTRTAHPERVPIMILLVSNRDEAMSLVPCR